MNPQETKKILIVDDEESILNSLKAKLVHEGYEVITAKDGEEGLKVALEFHPDLILLDILMPKMDGIEMLDKLREDSWGKDAAAIFLTNLSSQEKETQARAKNPNDYIIKAEVGLSSLIEKIKENI